MNKFQILHPTTGKTVEVSQAIFEEFTMMNKAEQTVRWPRLLELVKASELLGSPEPPAQDSIAATLAQRGSRYGDFTDHAKIAQDLQKTMQHATTKDSEGVEFTAWMKLSPVQRQALTVIADKIARILSGDPNYDDNWHDIQGYAKLVEDRLPKDPKKEF